MILSHETAFSVLNKFRWYHGPLVKKEADYDELTCYRRGQSIIATRLTALCTRQHCFYIVFDEKFGTSYYKMKNCKIKQDLKLPGVEEVIKRIHIKFFDNLRNCGNPLFAELTPPPPPSRWQGSKTAEKLVDLTRLNER